MSDNDPKAHAHVKKELKDYWIDTMVCTSCGYCKSVCPAFQVTKRDTRSPRGKVVLSYGILNKDFEPDESVRDALYICSTCMDCTRRCPSKVKTLEIIMAARKELAKKGLIPEGEKKVLENIAKFNNPQGEQQEKRVDFVPEEALARVGKGAEVLVYVGCVSSYSDMKLVKNLFDLMEKAKVDYTYLGKDEPCCGMMNYLVGFEVDGFAKAMKAKLDMLSPRPKVIVTPCPGCFRSFAQNFPEHVNLEVKTLHMMHFILGLLESGKLKVKKKLEGKVLYHDPCDLGRHAGIYEEPRKVLSYFATVSEFPFNRDQAHCCGGGGGLQSADFNMTASIAKARLKEAVKEGADIIVTACPSCKNTFSSVLSDIKDETGKNLKIVELTEIVQKNTVGE